MDKCIALVESYISDVKIVRPQVRVDLHGHTAGLAYPRSNRIRLNVDLLADPRYAQDMLHNTLPHEVAHIVTYQLWPEVTGHHNAPWRYVMENILNLPATRCHQYETKTARRRKTRRR